jgi:ribosomal protein S18 acetylase RimI-like enzyme
VGGRLLNAAIAHARHHHPGVSLSVSADNPARRLYERRGFRVVAEAGDSLTMLLRWG